MSTYGAVHFRGAEIAIEAFENRRAKSWALFTGKQFLASFVGESVEQAAEALDKYLSLMNQPGNIAVYTLKVYDDMTPGEKIKSNTPDDGSFNFRLQEPTPGLPAVAGLNTAGNYEMLQLLKKMDARIERLETEPVEEKEPAEPKNIMGQIKDFLELPGMQALISGVVQKLTGNAQAPSLGNINVQYPPQSTTGTAEYDPEVNEYTALIDAYKIIKNSGLPDALAMLQKLADIAATDQEKFKSIVSGLKMFL